MSSSRKPKLKPQKSSSTNQPTSSSNASNATFSSDSSLDDIIIRRELRREGNPGLYYQVETTTDKDGNKKEVIIIEDSDDEQDNDVVCTKVSANQSIGKRKRKVGKPVAPKYDDSDGHYIITPNEELTSRYTITRLLGQGTFGRVAECYDHYTGSKVAVKIIRAIPKYREAAAIEIKVLELIKKQRGMHCIELLHWFDYRNHICMVFPLLGSSVFDFLKSNQFQPFDLWEIRVLGRQILESVQFLHQNNLIHTDLKPENILLQSSDYKTVQNNRILEGRTVSKAGKNKIPNTRNVLSSHEISVIDFGSAAFAHTIHTSVVSTRHYRAPEIILDCGWSFQCDLWSVGCILVELFTGEALFQTHDNLEHLAMMEVILSDGPRNCLWNKLKTKVGKGGLKYFKNTGKLAYPAPDTKRDSKRFVRSLRPLTELIQSSADLIPSPTPYSQYRSKFPSYPHSTSYAPSYTTRRTQTSGIPPSPTPSPPFHENPAELQSFYDLLTRLLDFNPDTRLTASQALNHPFFTAFSPTGSAFPDSNTLPMEISPVSIQYSPYKSQFPSRPHADAVSYQTSHPGYTDNNPLNPVSSYDISTRSKTKLGYNLRSNNNGLFNPDHTLSSVPSQSIPYDQHARNQGITMTATPSSLMSYTVGYSNPELQSHVGSIPNVPNGLVGTKRGFDDTGITYDQYNKPSEYPTGTGIQQPYSQYNCPVKRVK
ncbi:kinase-like domain-containing protein [Paraphysoderma sedebokerense]|nr:kinase-like domain-containing protein [Paraphysoderma sedebokerense]